jgi:hypothetical protein
MRVWFVLICTRGNRDRAADATVADSIMPEATSSGMSDWTFERLTIEL